MEYYLAKKNIPINLNTLVYRLGMQHQPPSGFVWTTRLELAENAWDNGLVETGMFDLLPNEIVWSEIQPFLQSRGYSLRERYHSGWKPSPSEEEHVSELDFVLGHHAWVCALSCTYYYIGIISLQEYLEVLDAIRISDGMHVMLKHVSLQRDWSQELDIYARLSSPKARSDSRNCTSILIDGEERCALSFRR